MNIILASGSRYKKAILTKLGIPFSCISPDIDESAKPDEDAEALSARLALAKANKVKALWQENNHSEQAAPIIVAVDQVASHANKNLGKPGNYENASRQLARFSNNTVTFYSAMTVIHPQFPAKTVIETYKVKFRELSAHQIHQYLLSEEPYDCAGSFKCEGKGILLFQTMEGRDINSLVGLPLIALNEVLLGFGVDLLDHVKAMPTASTL
ncbi:MAG: Maf family protein [Aestuariibacter sp.]